MNIILTKVKQNTNMLKVSNKFLSQSTKEMVYHSHILSQLTNGLLLWRNMVDNTTLTKIQKHLNKCYTLMTHENINTKNLKKDGFLTIRDLIKVENCKLAFKHKYNLLPSNIQELMKTDSLKNSLVKEHNYDTRHKTDLNLPQARHKAYHGSYLMRAIKDYSSLPITLKEESKLIPFVKRLKRHLLK